MEGHKGGLSEIVYGDVISSPWNGTAYAAGEQIVFQLALTYPVDRPESLVLPFWLGDGAEHRREAELIDSQNTGFYFMLFAYTVVPSDTDTDGIYISADPLGDNAGGDLHFQGDAAVPAHTRLAANQLPSDQSVDGSRSSACGEVLCSNLTVDIDESGFGGTTIRGDPAVPYEPSGAASTLTFEYASKLHILSYVVIFDLGRDDSLSVNFSSEIAQALVNRGAFDIDGTRFLLMEADDAYSDDDNAYFGWNNPGLTWSDNDVLDVKIVETATATFDAATYTHTEGDTFDVTVTLGEAFTNALTLPIKVEANGGATEEDYSFQHRRTGLRPRRHREDVHRHGHRRHGGRR